MTWAGVGGLVEVVALLFFCDLPSVLVRKVCAVLALSPENSQDAGYVKCRAADRR